MKYTIINSLLLIYLSACSWQNDDREACRGVESNTSGFYKNHNLDQESKVCGMVTDHYNTQPLFSDDLSTAIGHNYMFTGIYLTEHRQLFVLLTNDNTDYLSSSFDVTFDLTQGTVHNFRLNNYESGNMTMRFGSNFINFDYADFHVIKEAGSTNIKGSLRAKGLMSVQQGASTHVVELDFTFDMTK